MQYEVYKDLYIKEGLSVFEFFSIGKKGVIPKRIVFMPTEYSDVYNLMLGDIEINDEINDMSITANGDRNKVLSTVAHVVEIYLKTYPERWVFFTGSTKERTRLYRMAIGINLDYLLLKFEVYSKIGNDILPFQKNMELDGFLIRIKS
ncbi:DUF6934 family protein [Chitinophaga filiformis]|uniref:Uncharacterized protein n=1 Tax=Chitinophaga filiformis TaxID=104663 RepID=A0ABY4HWV9_CHIFI|nr:hypothetical protein [Chitinophaga filiformis]UPK68299.1 hypothetical protein MYF79_25410 [Chitinophaga filiformis]